MGLMFVIAQSANAALIGLDWGAAAPTNWNVGTEGANPQTLNNLIDENGVVTTVDVSYSGTFFSNTTLEPFTASAGQIPTHSNSLANISGGLNDADQIVVTFSDLIPNQSYDVWLFGAQNEAQPTFHDVTITGLGPAISFTQNFSGTPGELWVNGVIGSNALLDSFAVTAIADALGQLIIDVNDDGGTTNTVPVVTLAGVAIRPVPEPTILPLMTLGLAGVGYRLSKKASP